MFSQRLNSIASLVRKNRYTADVGTDHAYLPVLLVLSGVTNRAVASDINEDPLKKARSTLNKYSLEDSIELIISDGLKSIPKSADEFVISGMGGTLISEILSESIERIKSKDVHLVLQPMTRTYDVRKFLSENGFFIDREKFSEDDGRVYVSMSAYFSGKDERKSDYFYFFGDFILKDDTLSLKYFKKQKNIIDSKAEGLKHTGDYKEYDKYLLLQKKAQEFLTL